MLRTPPKRLPRATSLKPRTTSHSHNNQRTIHTTPPLRTTSAAPQNKREGDISDSFATLAGIAATPLPDEYRQLKLSLVAGHEEQIKHSWTRLLAQLKVENDVVARLGSKVIPEVRFSHLDEDLARARDEIRKRGVVVVRGVISEREARGWKGELDEYIRVNPQTKGFPPTNPQVWELYWSAPQHRARLHPNLTHTQKTLMRTLWHTTTPPTPPTTTATTTTSPSPSPPISLSHPLTYADRLRIRTPNDTTFALGPHQDGGSVERWHPHGYATTYSPIFTGHWDSSHDPWHASAPRIAAVTDLHNGLGACSAFRMFQGWLSLSATGGEGGGLLVNPLLREAGAYALLRPFFAPRNGGGGVGLEEEEEWDFTAGAAMTSDLPGATPGYGMEFPAWGAAAHPHLELHRTMVRVPSVRPGDFVVWHCDTIHAVEAHHPGPSDASALYIPVCPATATNAHYVARMRAAWRAGTPAPDFPGGKGESEHVGRPDEAFVRKVAGAEGLASFGLEPLVERHGDVGGGESEREAVRVVNEILGF